MTPANPDESRDLLPLLHKQKTPAFVGVGGCCKIFSPFNSIAKVMGEVKKLF